jgi:glycosyltransferase involved in cell wall biosynthesis
MEKKLTIIIPVFNEEKTLLKLLEKVKKIKTDELEVVVVNDGSNDGTEKIIIDNNSLYDQFVNNTVNMGKGHAVKEGLSKASGEYVIFQDADLEYDPEDIRKFVELINKFNPDLILGSRFNYDKFSKSHSIFNKIGNLILTNSFNLLYNTTFTDIYSCYMCFKKKLIEPKDLKTIGFEQHAEILAKTIKKGSNFFEVPINYNGRSTIEGKKIRFYHFFPVFFRIILERIRF